MAQQYINIGTNPNDGTGDVMRTCFTKADNNFSELYFTDANLTSNLSNLSTAVNIFEGYVYNQLGAVSNTVNAVYVAANNANLIAQQAFLVGNTANQAWLAANAALAYASLVAGGTNQTLNTAFATANAAFGSSNGVGSYANNINTFAQGVSVNTTSAFNQANAAVINSGQAFNTANQAVSTTITQTSQIATINTNINNINYQLNWAFGTANAAFNQANNDLTLANYIFYLTNTAFNQANAGYTLAAAAIPAYNGTATGTLSMLNMTASGTATFAGVNTIGQNGGAFRTGSGSGYAVRIYPQSSSYTNGILQFTDAYQSAQWGSIYVNTSTFNLGSDASIPVVIRASGSNIATFNTTGLSITGQLWTSDNITAYFSSDIRLKENVMPILNALDKIRQIRGVEFDWTKEFIEKQGGEDGYFVRKHDVGVIAQEIEKVLPEVVAEREDGTLAVKYEKIVPLLIQAIKELSKEVEKLKYDISK